MATGVALALVIGVVTAYRVSIGIPPELESRAYEVGIASAAMLVDSPNSQVVDLSGGQAPADVPSLLGRAQLLASLIVTSPLKERIARRAGVDAASMSASVLGAAPISIDATSPFTPETDGPRATILTVSLSAELPIIDVDAQASTAAAAARMSTAAVEELGAYLNDVASRENVSGARRLVVRPLGQARSATAARGPGRTFALIAAVGFLVVWCAGIVIGSAMGREWRQAEAEDFGGIRSRLS